MSRNNKIIVGILIITMMIIAGCAGAATEEPTEVPTEAPTDVPTEEPTEVAVEETEAVAEAADLPIESFCLVTDVGRVNDGTFNQSAHEGAQSVAADFELDYEFIETVSEADYDTNIQTCLDDGADVVITVGFLIQDATAAAAEANPGNFFIGIDQFLVDGPENFVGVQFAEDQAGFLVGALAALVANANDEDVIAGIYGLPVPAVVRYRNGYEQGAKYINSDWEAGTNMLGTYADSFVDLAQGASLANQFIGEDAYIIFGAGGQTGSAGIAEAASQGVYVIGVDQDEYNTTFAGGETEGAEYLITSALKRVDTGVYDLISFLAEGDIDAWNEYAGGNYVLDAALDGVGFAPAHDADVDPAIYEEVEHVLDLLVASCISTGVDPVSGELLSEEDMEAFEPAEGCEDMMAMEDMDSEEADMEATEEMEMTEEADMEATEEMEMTEEADMEATEEMEMTEEAEDE